MPSAGGFRRRDWKLRLVRARLCARCVCVCEACVRARVRWLNRRQHSAHSLSATPPVSPRKPRVCDRPPGHVFPVLGEGSRPCRTVCRSLLRCQGRLAHQRPSALGPPPRVRSPRLVRGHVSPVQLAGWRDKAGQERGAHPGQGPVSDSSPSLLSPRRLLILALYTSFIFFGGGELV